MSASMISVDNCPRDLAGLANLNRGVRFRLCHNLSLFTDDAQEAAFLSAKNEDQCNVLFQALQERDARVAASGGAPEPMEAPSATQIALGPTTGVQMPPVVAPLPPPTPNVQMPTSAQIPPPGVQMPPQPGQVIRMPSNRMATTPAIPPPQMAPPVVAPPLVTAPVVRAPQAQQAQVQLDGQVMKMLSQMVDTLKCLSDTSQRTQKWLEDREDKTTKLLKTILRLQLCIAEQANVDLSVLAKVFAATDPTAIDAFLGEAPKGGK